MRGSEVRIGNTSQFPIPNSQSPILTMPITVTITETRAIDEQLGRVNAMLRHDIVRRAVRAGAVVVQRAIKAKIPRSSATGTRKKWSKTTRSKRQGVKPHADTIGLVVREYGHYFVAIVGAQYPAGALYHLLENDHSLVAWGVPTDTVITGQPYTEQAGDETKAEQQAAIEGTVRKLVDSLLG